MRLPFADADVRFYNSCLFLQTLCEKVISPSTFVAANHTVYCGGERARGGAVLADVSLFLVLISIFLGHVEENDYQVITENYDNYCVILKIYL